MTTGQDWESDEGRVRKFLIMLLIRGFLFAIGAFVGGILVYTVVGRFNMEWAASNDPAYNLCALVGAVAGGLIMNIWFGKMGTPQL